MVRVDRSLSGPLGCSVMLLVAVPRSAFAQTTQPAVPEQPQVTERKPYDPWTSKLMTGDWGGLRTELDRLGIRFDLDYQQHFQQNFRGGLDTHNAHRLHGSYDAVLRLDFGKMKLIDHAGFYIKAKGTWSESPNEGINPDKVGASGAARVNSDAGNDYPIFVDKWWYWHKFLDDKAELRLGVLETNKDLYDVGTYANHEDKDFVNRLSIRNATLPHRTGMGAYLKVTPVDWFYFQAAAIDAQSRARRTGFDTAFHDESWFIGLWEFGFTPKWDSPKGPMPGNLRMGLWYDPQSKQVFEDNLGGRREPSFRGDDVGFYVGFDQMIWKEKDDPKDDQGLGFYARWGYAHRDVNRISDYWSTGVSYTGLIPTRDKDVTAFGVSQALYSTQYRHEAHPTADRETVYEWYYKFYLTPWCNVSPDVQVITNPGGDKDDRDALVGGVRVQITF